MTKTNLNKLKQNFSSFYISFYNKFTPQHTVSNYIEKKIYILDNL